MNYRIVLYLWLFLFLFPGRLKAQVYTDRKVASYQVSEKTSVEVSNKYGKINVITWDKDSVRFEVDVRFSAGNMDKLQKLKNNIKVEFAASKYYVIGKTTFNDIGSKIGDFVETFIPSNQVSINYMVYVPKQINLKIDNKFGDIYLDDFNGSLDLKLSNGDLKANKISGTPLISVSSGNGTINSITGGRVLISYSDIRIKQADNLDLESRSSRVTIDQGSNVKIDSRRDKLNIVTIENLSVTGYFTTVEIEDLKKEFRSSLKYGSLMVDHVDKDFTFLNVNSEYADIDLFFDRSTAYNIDITHHNDVTINLPAILAKVQTKDLDTELKLKLTYGKIGNASEEKSPKVKVTATKKCIINIIHK
jgi:hypothetical protein